jgi:hypothetical protein
MPKAFFYRERIKMPTITKKQLAEYEQLKKDRDNGRLLTPEGLRFICEANGYDPEKIGKHFLEVLPKICHSMEESNDRK